jgi:mannose-6-phosphate isomerase-like protein (cupin superfamily)
VEARPDIVESGVFDREEYSQELTAAPGNHDLGSSLWFENQRVRVWEVLLQPGERGPFHAHTSNYFWTVVEASRGLQRFADGTFVIRDYQVGETKYLEHTPATALIHDLENVGATPLRFVTVEILD